MSRKCPDCGKVNREDAKVCAGCGKPLAGAGKKRTAAQKREMERKKRRNRMIIALSAAALLILLALLWFLLARQPGSREETAAPSAGGEELHHAVITVKDYGAISLELDASNAPLTVANFMKLAREGFYDGLTFHRIMDGFMIQGGDPEGNGTGGSDETIPGEFSQNGVNNTISHVKGVISMARSNDPDSASSQFFITVADATFLDGSYAAFGRVTEGMEVAEQIARDARPIDNNGSIPADQQPVIESIVIID